MILLIVVIVAHIRTYHRLVGLSSKAQMIRTFLLMSLQDISPAESAAACLTSIGSLVFV